METILILVQNTVHGLGGTEALGIVLTTVSVAYKD